MTSDPADLMYVPGIRDAAAPSKRDGNSGMESLRQVRAGSNGMRVTLSEVARQSGFSTATVERALNNRSGVRLRTRQVVVDTARRLGYISDTSFFVNAGGDLPVRLEFILPEGSNMFIRALHGQLEAQAALREDVDVRITTLEGFNPDRLALALAKLRGDAQGVGIIALDHPTVREAIRDSPRPASKSSPWRPTSFTSRASLTSELITGRRGGLLATSSGASFSHPNDVKWPSLLGRSRTGGTKSGRWVFGTS